MMVPAHAYRASKQTSNAIGKTRDKVFMARIVELVSKIDKLIVEGVRAVGALQLMDEFLLSFRPA